VLEKMGYRADIAANGLEVLHSLARQNYDVILMDLQMPEMDGLTATREIRQSYTNHKPRIIAMTASVMQGDRENCLEAGMDDYISKPVKIEQLQAVLKRCYQLPTRKTTEHLTSKLTNKLSELTMLPPIDLSVVESLLQIQVPGEPNLLLELIDMFVKDTPKKLDSLRNALQQSDFVEVRRVAHTLKGSSGSLGANQMMKICAEMEQRCKNNSFEGLENILLQLEMEFIRAESVLLHEREKIAHLDLA
jgi:CheY-like chemotaxis protein